MTYETLVKIFLQGCTAVLAVCVLACLVRAIIGPRSSDRLVAVNMAGTQILCMIAMLCVITGETGFIDIGILYAMLSFVSVVVLTKVIGRRQEK